MHITHTHAPSHPGFWYPCDKKQIKDVLSSHLTYWGREQVKVDGDDVTREVPIAAVVATFCRGLTDEDGSAAPDRPEPIDVYATLGLARPESGRAATYPFTSLAEAHYVAGALQRRVELQRQLTSCNAGSQKTGLTLQSPWPGQVQRRVRRRGRSRPAATGRPFSGVVGKAMTRSGALGRLLANERSDEHETHRREHRDQSYLLPTPPAVEILPVVWRKCCRIPRRDPRVNREVDVDRN